MPNVWATPLRRRLLTVEELTGQAQAAALFYFDPPAAPAKDS